MHKAYGASAFGARGWNSGREFRAELRMLYVSCFSNERLCWLRNFARLLSVWVSLVMRLVWGETRSACCRVWSLGSLLRFFASGRRLCTEQWNDQHLLAYTLQHTDGLTLIYRKLACMVADVYLVPSTHPLLKTGCLSRLIWLQRLLLGVQRMPKLCVFTRGKLSEGAL